jgi:heme exporter protein B
VLVQLVQKEIKLELRRKSVVAGLTLYLFSTVFISYLAFALKQNLITPMVWSALFWITILFTAINTVAKSFIGERRGLDIYYYSIASPVDILLSKILYNFFLCLLLAAAGYFLFTIFLNDPIDDKLIFSATLALASFGFASSLTLLSGIASKANNSNILMAVLSFPILISILLIVIKITKNCIDGLDRSINYNALLALLAINCLVTAVSYLLFPFTWKN